MPFSLRFKRNNTVAQSKDSAMSTLKEKLKLAHAGEPLVVEYSVPGGGVKQAFFLAFPLAMATMPFSTANSRQ